MEQSELYAGKQRQSTIYEAVQMRIREGEWKQHDKLPSVRAMAERMQVHRLTVLKAYQQLADEGILYAKYKSGYFVGPLEDFETGVSSEQSWTYQAKPVYVNQSRLSDIHRHSVDYQMAEALIDPQLLPNAYMSNYVKEVFDLYPRVLSTYSSVMGDLELREAMAQFYLDKYGVSVDAAELMITTGSQQAIDLISRALVKPGDKVLIERPTYSPAIDAFLQHRIQLFAVEITPSGYDMAEIEAIMKQERPRLFYMNPTFQNPTGYTVPVHQRKQLIELAERYDCLLVEDDVYQDIYFGSPPPPPFFYYDTEGYVIYIRSFSKYVAPGLRISILAARPSVMSSIVPVKALSDNGTPLLNQKIFQHYFFSSRLQEHVVKLRTALDIRRAKMEQMLAGGWRFDSPNGGLNLWVQVPQSLSVEELLHRSLAQSMAFVPGSICDPLGGMKDRLRLSYSYMNESKLTEGIQRLVTLADELMNDKNGQVG
ncbi:DNA-binding transcriptional MocR family regulator [Paenibacillus phyllosphaerae]|uniref:DNA-binding transcriptional MocR family regulator n=1 Tax=Paenibacillus phyllosphaerae TaxID=274593 RepID=A0A7W5FQI3_9BACL|nr:PLP-dependent aminotransferase family protein [Paenibacillus phyllosphaerae]MBB3113471.1 DNA-binding transcriptional MocR family regulator [Paenibacillus phyllosphaerae]